MPFTHEPKSRKPTSPTGQLQMAERGSQYIMRQNRGIYRTHGSMNLQCTRIGKRFPTITVSIVGVGHDHKAVGRQFLHTGGDGR